MLEASISLSFKASFVENQEGLLILSEDAVRV